MSVLVLTTGGTIASLPDPETGAKRPAVSGKELVAGVPGLADVADVEVEEVAALSSWNLTPDHMLAVARRAGEALARPQVEGVVVTHGTDTVEETAFLTDLTLRAEGPAVFVGAMRSPEELSADGPRNLLNAVRLASAPDARGAGAVVAMSDEVHAARWVRKLDSGLVSAFRSPRRGPLGRVTPGSVEISLLPSRGFTVEPPAELSRHVALVTAYPGMDGAVIEAVLEATGAAGLVVEGSGSGNVPGTAVGGLRSALERGLPVVVATRVPGGSTPSGYGSPGGGAELRGLGAVGAGPLSAGKARLLLMVLLAQGLSGEAVAREYEAAAATFR
ncbi:MAG TPA: asparaginase [Thermoleophilaceae bacterium]|nr:asparaginase [Thermoleophilaceae bacterium]